MPATIEPIPRRRPSPALPLVLAVLGSGLLAGCLTTPLRNDLGSRVDTTRTVRPATPASASPRTPSTVSTGRTPVKMMDAPVTQTPGEYSGPPRWPLSASDAEWMAQSSVFSRDIKKGQLLSVEYTGDPKAGLAQIPLAASNERNFTFMMREGSRDVFVKPKVLQCVYGTGTPNPERPRDKLKDQFAVTYWPRGERKELHPKMFSHYLERSDGFADVEQDQCPPNLADAIQAGFGDSAWPKIAEGMKTATARMMDNVENNPTRLSDYADWDRSPKANSRQRDVELARQIRTALDMLKSKGNRLEPQLYYQTLHNTIQPALAELAGSGLVQSQAIAAGMAGRAAFEAWDTGIGFTVVQLALDLRRFGTGGRRFQMPDVQIFVLDRYQAIYRDQLADKGAFESGYFRKMLADIEKYKELEQASQASGIEPSRPTNEYVMMMRPRQSLLYRKLDEVAKAIARYAELRAQQVQYVRELDQSVRSSRAAFWSCYATRCPQGGVLYLKYSLFLNERDRYFGIATYSESLLTPDNNSGEAMQSLVRKILATDIDVDGGPTLGCEAPYDNYLSLFVNLKRYSADRIRSQAENALYGKPFEAVQSCRDIMEFVMRPRSKPAGLR